MMAVDGSGAAMAQRLRRLARALRSDPAEADRLALDVLEKLPRRIALEGALAALIRSHRAIETRPSNDGISPMRGMAAVFAALPLDQREALALVAIEKLSHATAARILGIETGILFERLSAARAALALAQPVETGRPVTLRLVK